MSALTAATIAAALRKSRPADLFTNERARKQWYADVTALAEALRDTRGFDATKFFDTAGVPT